MSDPMLPVGSNRAKCTMCDRYFTSSTAFDLHLTADACVDPATIKRKDGSPRLIFDEATGYWRYPETEWIKAKRAERERSDE